MPPVSSPLEIYKFLQKSNCRQCQIPTCLAFAAAVIKGEKRLNDCPHLENDIIERFDGKIAKRITVEQQQEQILGQLKREIAALDFSSSAERLGASFSGGKLKIKCLGKYFVVDSKGNVTSDCHINAWVTIPLLSYVISSTGKNVSGKWVPFRELENGVTWQWMFGPLCEKPLKQLADDHTDLFEDILYILDGKPVENRFSADISFILHPLPKVPMLISYCKPEDNDDFESKLNVFFDITAEDNLNIESIFGLGAGLGAMLNKFSLRYTW